MLANLVLAMSHAQLGQQTEARAALARAVAATNWSEPAILERADQMIYHVLRREAEPLVLPNLPAFLDGRYQPTDNNERIAFTAECAFTKRYATAARLWTDALAAEPLRLDECFDSAMFALTQAGHGIGVDASGASESDRAKWRATALDWLQTLVVLAQPPTAEARQAHAIRILTIWCTASELADIRNGSHAAQLPQPERDAWSTAWRQADEVLIRAKQR